MHLKFRNVNDAFIACVNGFETGDIPTEKKDTRNGPAYVCTEPVLITYSHPWERVLFNAARDANCFFHLFEALWMLAGRDDVGSLSYYNSNISNYSDDGKRFNGAYGMRWRCASLSTNSSCAAGDWVDQIPILIRHLKQNPDSRRAVLQMWNVEDDLLKIGGGQVGYSTGGFSDGKGEGPVFDPGSKDVCCNLSVLFSLRETTVEYIMSDDVNRRGPTYLDMTVTNRSNDMIWGLFGSNYVCFSILHEYMASMIGVEVGLYHHFTNNLHVYLDNWKAQEWLEAAESETVMYTDSYGPVRVPLVTHRESWDEDNRQLVSIYGDPTYSVRASSWGEPFFDRVAVPMFRAFALYKTGRLTAAVEACDDIRAEDWRVACSEWLVRRIQRRSANAPSDRP